MLGEDQLGLSTWPHSPVTTINLHGSQLGNMPRAFTRGPSLCSPRWLTSHDGKPRPALAYAVDSGAGCRVLAVLPYAHVIVVFE